MRWFEKKAMILKPEAAYSTDPVPTGAADWIEARNLTIRPLVTQRVPQQHARTYFGGYKELIAGQHIEMDFDVAMAGAGAAGTAAPYGKALRACAWAETLTALTDAQYEKVSASQESAAAYFNMDGKRQKVLGMRGSAGYRIAAGEIPVFRFKMMALYEGPTDTAFPAVTTTAWQEPLPVNNVNTPTFSLFGYAATLYELEVNVDDGVQYRNLPGAEEIYHSGRTMTGTVVIEEPTQAQKDYFALAKAGTLGAIQVIHGTAAGNIVQIDHAQVQLTDPQPDNRNGVAVLRMGIIIVPTAAGNDEGTITIT